MFSKAYTGESPVLSKLLGRSIVMILANLIFFMPRRTVTIEIEDMTTILRKWHKEGLEVFNKRLQDHYNRDGNEEC
jgi:long-chain-fatty-acid--[acyl-carrier-protein] ligase